MKCSDPQDPPPNFHKMAEAWSPPVHQMAEVWRQPLHVMAFPIENNEKHDATDVSRPIYNKYFPK